MGIGKRLKEARRNKGLTQEVLATMIGVTKGAIANYENETSHPKESVMYALINALGIDANFLFQDCVEIKTTPLYSSKAMEIARIYDALDDKGKQRLYEAAEREQDIKASMDDLIRNVVVLKICDDPIIGSAGIELKDGKLRDQLFSIPKKIPSDQHKVLIKLRDKQIRRPLGVCFHHPNQDEAEIVFIIDQGVEAKEGQPGLFNIDGKNYLGKVKDGQFLVFPEYISLGQTHQNVKSEGIVIGYVDLKYILGI